MKGKLSAFLYGVVSMENDRNHPIAVALRGLRKESGLTQIDLEVETGICKKRISAVENGDMEVINNLKKKDFSSWKTTCHGEMIKKGLIEESQSLLGVIRNHFNQLFS
jgi:DNA-binding XRE family transcriptional regulator